MFIRKNAAVIFRFGNRTTCHAFRPWLAPNRPHAPLLCAEIAASPLAKDAWTDVVVPPAARKIYFDSFTCTLPFAGLALYGTLAVGVYIDPLLYLCPPERSQAR